MRPNRFVQLAAAELLAGFLLRALALMQMPLQWLEAFNITQAHTTFLQNPFFFDAELKKWLSPVVLSIFEPLGPEGPWIARFISVLLGTLSIAACINLARRVGNRRIGLVAGALYAVLPLTVFHERQGLADVLLATCCSLATLFIVRLAQRPHMIPAVLLGITLAGAYLAKITALPYFLLPAWALLLLTPPSKWLRAVSWMLLGIAIALILICIPYTLYMQHNPTIYTGLPDALVHQIAILNETSGSEVSRAAHIQRQLNDLSDLVPHYIGWPVLAITLTGAVLTLRTRTWRAIAFLAVPAIVFMLPVIASQSTETSARDPFFAARYMLHNMVPLMVMAALAVAALIDFINQRWTPRAALVSTTLLALMVFPPWLLFDLSLYGDPAKVSLSEVDDEQYLTGGASGFSFVEIARQILEISDRTGKPAHVLTRGDGTQIAALIGQRIHTIERLEDDDNEGQRHKIAHWLSRGESVLIYTCGQVCPISLNHFDTRLEQIGTYKNGWWGETVMYQVVGAQGALAQEVYTALATDPAKLAQNYQDIGVSLHSADLVLIFPANHAQPLSADIGRSVTPLTPPVWPYTGDMSSIPMLPDGALADVILVDETSSDPQRLFETDLLSQWFRLEESWSGSLHRIRYITGPSDSTFPPLNAEFEGTITLTGGGTLDPVVKPSDVVRFALTWQTEQVIRDSFKFFIHIIGADSTVYAQFDGVPGWGLLPMTEWVPNKPVTDRFALRLPSNIPAGTYDLSVGIYLPDTGPRLKVVSAKQHGPDYVVIGQLEVK